MHIGWRFITESHRSKSSLCETWSYKSYFQEARRLSALRGSEAFSSLLGCLLDAPPWELSPHCNLHHMLQGNSALLPRAPPHPALIWWLQDCFSRIFSLLSLAAIAAMQQLFPLLNCIVPEVLSPLLMGLALAVGPSWGQLALSPPDMGAACGSFSQKTLCHQGFGAPLLPCLPAPRAPRCRLHVPAVLWKAGFG